MKPLTKALHTVRIVEAVARHIVAKHKADAATPAKLYAAVLWIIDNSAANDEALTAQCLEVCKRVIAE